MTSPSFPYLERIHTLLDEMAAANAERLPEAANRLAGVLAAGGVIHAFGSGHSSLLAQEVFHRAGGLAPVNAMLDVNLTIFGTSRPSLLERQEGYAASLFTTYDVREGEAILVMSNSGINPVPIEVAQLARERGVLTLAVGSAAQYANAVSRHSSGKTLFDVAEIVLDTCVPKGDALQAIGETGITIGAASTILGSALLNLLVIATAEALDAGGHAIPAFVSQNMPGGDEANQALMERYRPRIPLMKP
jgi:uncharacterized phosphosugar-binding protein